MQKSLLSFVSHPFHSLISCYPNISSNTTDLIVLVGIFLLLIACVLLITVGTLIILASNRPRAATILETRHQDIVMNPNRRRPRCENHAWADCDLVDFDNRRVNPDNGDFNFSDVYQCNNSTCVNSFIAGERPTFKRGDMFQRCINHDCYKLRCAACKKYNVNT